MVMTDSTNGKVVASVPVGAGVDAAAVDPCTQLAIVSVGGAGTATIAREETPDQLSVGQTLTSERAARTTSIDPATHNIHLASASFEPAPANPAPDAPRRRPRMKTGSFKVLVYGMAN